MADCGPGPRRRAKVEADARRSLRSERARQQLPSAPLHAHCSLLTSTRCVRSVFAGGIGFWTFAFPQDLIKSIIQTHSAATTHAATATPTAAAAQLAAVASSPTFLSTPRQLVAAEGVGRLWRGFPVALFRGVPGAAITFTTYTTVMQNINRQGW